ncbi:hypothetical protein SDC9_110913 [bioreactor metagenome]|uniref:Uncharacterized protein n=1 Tax=bioreactor metagenome TaxID=1076179 RepID=A0A645BFC3_9ZZZZ
MAELKYPQRHLFREPVNKRSRREMAGFLSEHFRYDTGNSWNRSSSYACNMKIDRLGLPRDVVDKLFGLIQCSEFYDHLGDLLHQFGETHDFRWQAGWNGRSGGYLVLYQGERKPSGYQSFCTCCGQKNYRSVVDSGKRCGRCGREARTDFAQPDMQIITYPFRDTDGGECFEDWSLWELRQRTELVQSFDELADDIVSEALYLAEHYVAEEEFVPIPTPRMMMREAVS